MKLKHKKAILGTFIVCTLVLFGIPLLLNPTSISGVCPLKVSAQDNPCLSQEVTIGAQQIQILGLQATSNAQALQIIGLQGTNEALQEANANQPMIVITVPIVMTATEMPPTFTASPENVVATKPAQSSGTGEGLPPTSTNSQVEITDIQGAGNVSTEGIVIRNTGDTINVKDWTLSDSNGNVYTFSERFLFSQALIVINTRSGVDTPQALFMNHDEAILRSSSDFIVLRDDKGNVQSVYRLP